MARIGNGLWQCLVITHRYLGVAIGLLMVMWFVSGMVMMYVGFPRVTEEARVRTLPPMSWGACCHYDTQLADDEPILQAQVETVAGSAIMRLRRPERPDMSFDLAGGAAVRVDAHRAQAIAHDAAPRILGHPARVLAVEPVETDQWTVGRLARDRPFYRVAFDDPAATSMYVSGTSGQVVLWTTAPQRFWNWLGTVPHFLYFTELRRNVALWSQIVIWAALLGTFLTMLGLYLGIAQLGAAGKRSPYRGWMYWHHIIGLVFGLVTLTWVASGLVSMNPWGFLEGGRGDGAQTRIQGATPRWSEVRHSLDALRTQTSVARALSLVTVPLAGQLYWLATLDDGSTIRLDARGDIAAPTTSDLVQTAQRLAATTTIAEQRVIDQEDAYYFKRRGESLVLPVYRVILGDGASTRYYLDPRSGTLLQRADAAQRWHRWLFGALHRIDFAHWLRARPLWDVVVLSLMLGGLGVAATGCYLAIRRVRDDLARLFGFAASNSRERDVAG